MHNFRSDLICQILTNFEQVSYEKNWSSTNLIYLIIEWYFLVKDDSKISDISSRSELFTIKDDFVPPRLPVYWVKGYSEI